MGREVGGGIGMGKTCEPKAFSFQCMTEFTTKKKKDPMTGPSLEAQWQGICLPMQETQVPPLVGEDPTCRGTTKPVGHNYRACVLEPGSHNY